MRSSPKRSEADDKWAGVGQAESANIFDGHMTSSRPVSRPRNFPSPRTLMASSKLGTFFALKSCQRPSCKGERFRRIKTHASAGSIHIRFVGSLHHTLAACRVEEPCGVDTPQSTFRPTKGQSTPWPSLSTSASGFERGKGSSATDATRSSRHNG